MNQMDFSSEQQHQQQQLQQLQQLQHQQHQQHQQQLLDEVTHELISAISFVKTRSPEYNYVSTRQIVAHEKSVALFSIHNPYYSGTPLLITDFKLYWSSDRDRNGCNNMKKLFNCYLSSVEIPKAYSRKHKLVKKSSTAIQKPGCCQMHD